METVENRKEKVMGFAKTWSTEMVYMPMQQSHLHGVSEPSRRITRATSSEKKYKFTPFR